MTNIMTKATYVDDHRPFFWQLLLKTWLAPKFVTLFSSKMMEASTEIASSLTWGQL